MTDWLAGQRITADRLNDNTQRIVEFEAITANTATTTTTEAVGITTASITFETGRAYRITMRALGQIADVGDTIVMRVRKTNTAGTIYLDSFRLRPTSGGQNQYYHDAQICANTTGTDVTAVLVGTYVRGSAGGTPSTVLMAASATHVSYIQVEDIGVATDFTSAVAIT